MDTKTRRDFIKSTLSGTIALGLAGTAMGAEKKGVEEKPNIVFILVDDMGWSDITCYGSEIATPHIDRLAYNGLRFTQAYNTSKCFPPRACLLTGVYAQQCGMDNRHGKIRNALTLGEVLKSAGYRTLAAGKHHGTENLYNRGFDHYYGLRDGGCNYFNPGVQRAGEPKPACKTTRHWCNDEKEYHPFTPKSKDFYTTDAFTDKALEWIEKPEGEDTPFFLYLAYTAPHYPLQAWPEDIAKYAGAYDVGYQKIRNARYRRQIEMGLVDPNTTPLPQIETPREWSSLSDKEKARETRRMEVYAAMIARLDQNIGRLLATLENQGKLKNTLIFFAADNGACAENTHAKFASNKIEDIGKINSYEVRGKDWAIVQDTPYRKYKNYSHEGGICTPLIAYWDGQIKNVGGYCRQPVHFIDIMATLVDITGADYPRQFGDIKVTPMQGKSIAPAFQGDSIKRKEALFWKWASGGAIRDGNMKAVFHGRQRDWQLYDLAKDRNELNDLGSQKPEVLADMVSKWENWFRKGKQ